MGGANRATTLCPERASKALHTKGETRTQKLLVLGTTIALLAITNAPAAAAANDLVCTGEVSSGTYGNVTVPAGNSCQLSGSVVVQGHFVATGAVDVVVSGATIEGNVRIEQSTGSAVVLNRDTTVGGNLEIADNTVEDVILVGSTNTGGVTIVGNVEITGNTAEAVVANASTFMRNVSITHNAATDAVQVDCNVFTGGNVDLSANIATNEGGLIELVSDCTVFGLPLGGEVNGKHHDDRERRDVRRPGCVVHAEERRVQPQHRGVDLRGGHGRRPQPHVYGEHARSVHVRHLHGAGPPQHRVGQGPLHRLIIEADRPGHAGWPRERGAVSGPAPSANSIDHGPGAPIVRSGRHRRPNRAEPEFTRCA